MSEHSGLLSAIGCQGRELFEVPIGDAASVAYVIAIDADEVLSRWSAAHDVIAETKRYPVVVQLLGSDPDNSFEEALRSADLFSRFYFREDSSHAEVSPLAICERARRVQLSEFLAAKREDLDDLFDDEEPGIEGPIDQPSWYIPENERLALVLLPIERGPESLAYISWFGATGDEVEGTVALLHRWQQEFGAQLVCHFGTILNFLVSQPPDNIQDARRLAEEQVAVAPCVIMLPGTTISEHAQSLVGSQRWQLHERP